MSELHQAVQDELAAHRPDRVPPFDAVRSRKRSRDRRRLATGGAALSAVVLAGAALVVVPSLGAGGDRLVPGQRAAPGGQEGGSADFASADGRPANVEGRRYSVSADGRTLTVAVLVGGSCERPGTASLTATETPGSIALRAYVTPPPPSSAPPRAPAPPGTTNACATIPNVQQVSVGLAEPLADRAVTDRFGNPLDEEGTPGGTAAPRAVAWTGAQVCLLGGGDAELCRDLGAAEARALQTVLDRAVLDTSGSTTDCGPVSRIYNVQFQHPAVRAIPAKVPLTCSPVTRGGDNGGNYRLDSASRNEVKQAYDEALPDRTAAFIERCVAGEQLDLAPELLGLTEDDLQSVLEDGTDLRVIGRDGDCLAQRRDLRPERVNVLVEDGRVVWAGRF